ncbi:hypothetical protein AK812_SmicGene18595 [Symbiodinium microadriaticum]|uniref:Uncharacterized protein n=1 Tax=Symbiodinium microadriaticum TaxID=2951 RepID=A0A1Q9DUS0_SYMMI|nr:hypothetical protein AK812_SmicGene18595 [Symbiodinium microadriaticum]
MFSGAGVKNDPLRDLPGLVEMDIRKGWDLNDDKIYGVVLWMAREGRVKHVVGGPPAGTFAPWHYKKDQEGRQRPLRSTHEPWGLREGLNPDESSKVLNEDVMQWCGYGCAQKLRMRAKRGITAGTMLGSVWSTRRTEFMKEFTKEANLFKYQFEQGLMWQRTRRTLTSPCGRMVFETPWRTRSMNGEMVRAPWC